MDKNAELLFNYLRAVIYDPANATLEIDKLDKEFRVFGSGLVYFANCVIETNQLAAALAKGDLSSAKLPSPENELAAPLKALHASLKHLTWQSKQVALGDYGQTVDFMGEFAESFNTMIRQLDSRQQALMVEIEASRQKTRALEQSNSLLMNIAAHIPECIVVIENESNDILFLNKTIKGEIARDACFLDELLHVIDINEDQLHAGLSVEYCYSEERPRYFSVTAYSLHWAEAESRAYIINDISDQREKLRQLEQHAYRDELTNLHNRFSGMQTLNDWMHSKKTFVLCFIDMNNLKFVNDTYGHNEGDFYIRSVADNLNAFSDEAIVCRTGGDEFMILAEGYSEEEAAARMEEIGKDIEASGLLSVKDYHFSISYGVVGVSEKNEMPASVILSIADERMYSHKRKLKAVRPS